MSQEVRDYILKALEAFTRANPQYQNALMGAGSHASALDIHRRAVEAVADLK